MNCIQGQGKRVFAGEAAQELDSSSDSDLVQALATDSLGKAELLHEASQADGSHAIALTLRPQRYPEAMPCEIIDRFD
jgi:hypothetical protein